MDSSRPAHRRNRRCAKHYSVTESRDAADPCQKAAAAGRIGYRAAVLTTRRAERFQIDTH